MDSNNVRSKKRKNCGNVDEDDDEEAKMEKFFGLIENLREARERLLMDQNGWAWIGDKNHNNNHVRYKEKKKVPEWEPRFQLEDFAQEPRNLVGVAFNNTGKAKAGRHHHQKMLNTEGLYLRLSL